MDLPPELTFAPFNVREAYALGVTPTRLRRRDLLAPYRGVRSTSPATPSQAYLPILRQWQCFSHTTAARLWGVALPRRLELEPLHVLAAYPNREPRMRGVVGHRMLAQSYQVRLLDGVALTAPSDTWCQLAALLTLDELVAAGDSLLRRRGPVADLSALIAARNRYGRRRGASKLLRAAALVRARTDSAMETALRLLLNKVGFPEPEVNLEIVCGHRKYFGDLVYLEFKVIVEYDGEQHRRDSAQFAKDVMRLETLAAAGWTVVRVLNAHFASPDSIARRVARALAARGWRPIPSKLHLLREDLD